MEFLTKPDDTLPLVVNMVMGECTVGKCVSFAKDVNIVAGIVKRQNRIAHVDCGSDMICNKIPKPDGYPKHNVATVYIHKTGVYGFTGDMTQQALLDYLSADKFKEEKALEPDMELYLEGILELNMPW